MSQVTYHTKRADGFYDGHILTPGDGITDMSPSYRVRVGKLAPPMFPATTDKTFVFIPRQQFQNMTAGERATLVKTLYFYHTQNARAPPSNWCPPANPCMPIEQCCVPAPPKKLGGGAIAGIILGVVGALGVATMIAKSRSVKRMF